MVVGLTGRQPKKAALHLLQKEPEKTMISDPTFDTFLQFH